MKDRKPIDINKFWKSIATQEQFFIARKQNAELMGKPTLSERIPEPFLRRTLSVIQTPQSPEKKSQKTELKSVARRKRW
ncbi:MAG TPA: hypothetical protein EYQ63_07185 [Fuerstia sp.]|nr:hypothetical protein [Fuerstiella sp.]